MRLTIGIAAAMSLYAMLATAAETIEACRSVASVSPPAADMPTVNDRNRLRNCASIDLYYGLANKQADARDARLCAYIELAQGEQSLPTQGAGMLMTIYANGSGVPRNAQLAKHFACLIEWQRDGIERLLLNIDEHAHTGKPVGVCDVAPFWPADDICSGYEEAIETQRIAGEQHAIASRWSASRRDAFALLAKAADVYAHRRESAEIFKNDRPARMDSIRNQFRRELLDAIKALDAPAGLPTRDLAALDRDLNAAYRTLTKAVERAHAENSDVYDPLTPASLRAAELAWLRYGDSWQRFRAAEYPQTSPERLRALLTEQRLAALRAVREEFHLDSYWPDA